MRSNCSAVEPAGGVAGGEALELHQAAHLGYEGVADPVEQIDDGGAVREFLRAAARSVHAAGGGEEGGECLWGGHSVGLSGCRAVELLGCGSSI